MAMSFTLVASCREALSGVVATRLIREQEAEDAKAKAYEEVSLAFDYREKGGQTYISTGEGEWRSSKAGRELWCLVTSGWLMAMTQGVVDGGLVCREGEGDQIQAGEQQGRSFGETEGD
jgi:hypothetical protein